MRIRRVIASAALALPCVVLAGCVATGAAPATGGPDAEIGPLTVVAIGDEVPAASAACPGCTGFVDSFAESLAAEQGRSSEVTSRARTDGAKASDIREQVRSGYVDNVIGGADVVIVSVGLNDQPPYEDDGPCGTRAVESDADAVAAVLAVSPDCVATRTADAAKELEGALEGVRERAPDASILVLTPYNVWPGSQADRSAPESSAATAAITAGALDAWRTAACAEASKVGARCIDLLSAFNGPQGSRPAGALLGRDSTAPSQAGNDLIRDQLLAASR